MTDCLSNAFYLYLFSLILLNITKPDFLLYHKGKKCIYKKFGCGRNKTLFSIHIISIILAVTFYYVSLCLTNLKE